MDLQPFYSSNIYTSGKVSIGGQTNSSIDFKGDIDWFKVYLIKGFTYEFEAIESNYLDLDMFLRNSSGISLKYDNDSGLGDDPKITYTATYTGNYFIDIADKDHYTTGAYTVKAKKLATDDYSGNLNTNGSLSIGVSKAGKIDFKGDIDWFKVYLIKGFTYEFEAIESNSLDLDMFLRNSSGTSLKYDNDSGLGDDPKITYTATYTGNYFIDVADKDHYTTGAYTVKAKKLATDDYSGNLNTNGSLSIGVSKAGKIDFKGDIDWFKVYLIKGFTYEFEAIESNSLDLDMFLRNSSGTSLKYDNDSGLGDDPKITYTATYTGNYFIDVADKDHYTTGLYTIKSKLIGSIGSNDDYSANVSTKGKLVFGQDISAKIDFKGDVDWFKVSLIKGFTYEFEAKEYNYLDLDMFLRNSAGISLKYDNDSGSGDDPKITYTATYTGDYFIDVADKDHYTTGAYTIKAKQIGSNDDFSGNKNTKGKLVHGVKTSGEIDFKGDVDWFKVSLIKGYTYQFDAEEYNYLDLDMFLRNSAGTSLKYDNDSGSGDDPKITYTATYTGDYFIDIADKDHYTTGLYTIKSTILSIADDYSSNISTTGLLKNGEKIIAKIDFKGDSDWFKISLIKGNLYQFDVTEKSLIDPYLYLRDSKGAYIAFDDNGGSDTDDSRIKFTATSSGDYFLSVGDLTNSNIGEYTIHSKTLTTSDDYSDDINTIGEVSIGGKKSGQINFIGDKDWFKVSLLKGSKYQFDVKAKNDINPYLHLINSQGKSLAYDNDSGNANDAKITYTSKNGGVYFLGVGDIDNKNSGTYDVFAKSISSSSNVDDYAGNISTKGTIPIGSSLVGSLDFNGDRDWFKVSLLKGYTYQFDSVESNSIDSFLHLRDEQGISLKYDNDSGSGDLDDARILFTPTKSGDYYLDIGDIGDNDLGDYTIYAQSVSASQATFSHINGYGSASAEKAFEKLLGIDLLSRPDDGGNFWCLDNIGAKEVWNGTGSFKGSTGNGAVVAVLDTGIDMDHHEFKNKIFKPWDFIDNDSIPEDTNGHGTHVAGTIAAANDGIGITGVAYDAKIMPLKVLGKGGTGNTLDKAIRYAVDNGADVINMSLGTFPWDHGKKFGVFNAIQYASSKGVVCVMASGNGHQGWKNTKVGFSDPSYPAKNALYNGIAVGAEDIKKVITYWCDKAGSTKLDYVTAPGQGVYSAWKGGGHQIASGTSMAAPHVAGIAALLKSYDKNLTADQIENLLTSSASNQQVIQVNNATLQKIDLTSSNNVEEGTINNDVLKGSAADDIINGSEGDDIIYSSKGSDVIDGGSGSDKVIFSGKYKDYIFSNKLLFSDTKGWSINELIVNDKRYLAPDGKNKLKNIEWVEFSDQLVEAKNVSLVKNYSGNYSDYKFYNSGNKTYQIVTEKGIDDITGLPNIQFADQNISAITDIKGTFDLVTGKDNITGKMFRLYNAAFKRFPDPSGLKYWITQRTSGVNSERVVASSFLQSAEFQQKYGSNLTYGQFINTIYNNVLGRLPDQSGYDYWVGQLSNGVETKYEVLLGFSESAENKTLFTEMTGF